MNKKIFVLIPLLISFKSIAQPSKLIDSMMGTSISAFDYFMDRLFDQTSCSKNYFGKISNENKKNICMTTIEYNYDDNLLDMNFFIFPENDGMKGFENMNDNEKNKVLERSLIETSEGMGVKTIEGNNFKLKLGLIQLTSIRHGWGTKNFNEDAIKEEIANRTVIHLRTNINNVVYTATRDHHGKISFENKASNL